MKRKVLNAVLILIIMFLMYIGIEFARFKLFSCEKPLITIDKKFCSKDSIVCYDENKNYTEIYYGIGFSIHIKYHLDSTEPINYTTVSKSFKLFYSQ